MSVRSVVHNGVMRQYDVERPRSLTARQIQFLDCAASGLTREETARALSVSVETVKSTRKIILRELGARTVAHAVALAFRRGLLPVAQGPVALEASGGGPSRCRQGSAPPRDAA